MAFSRKWAGRFINTPSALPVSFSLDGKPIAGIPDAWQPAATVRRINANILEKVFEGYEPCTGLNIRVECLEYFDFPVVEWTAWFTNKGKQPTPVISDLLALDGTFPGASPALWHCNGDGGKEAGFTFQESRLAGGSPLCFAPAGGRPCNGAFPYFRLLFQEGGLALAIGWPAQWSASFAASEDGVRVRTGQEKTRLRLMPGEKIRTPRITIMSWQGDSARAVNLWRRWYFAHILPRSDGHALSPRFVGHGTDEGEEFTAATEENQVRFINKWIERGIPVDTWWIDAGWYPCYTKDHKRRWWNTGTWDPDPGRFPSGLQAVSACAARNGIDLLLWFEPERVTVGSALHREHPEWLLRDPDWFTRTRTKEGIRPPEQEEILLNLGNPECRRWLTDHVCKLIRDNGIRIYRQDHNFNPLDHWRKNEAADRQGMNENLHVQGYLQYWDDLLARNPGLWIDACAAGGRRNDLETIRRSVPLHYSDYGYGISHIKLAFHHVMFEWLPYFKEDTRSWDLDGPARYDRHIESFGCHCAMAPMLIPAVDISCNDYDFDLLNKMIALWRKAAAMMLAGDYYPLTPVHRSPEKWVALQFDCPEKGCGFIQGIRLLKCNKETLVVRPRALLPDSVYLFENPETAIKKEMTGVLLSKEGFTFELPKRSAAIWFYRKAE